MTFLKDTKQSAIAPSRQPLRESRRFWLILGGGSIALHLVLLLGLRWMNFRATVATSTADPTPIELVELAPAPGGEASAPDAAIAPPASDQPASDQSANDQPAAPPPAASVPEVAAAPPLIPPSPEVGAPPTPSPLPLTPSEEAPPSPAPPPLPSPTRPPAPPAPASPPESTPAAPAPPAPTTPPETAEPTPAQPGESPSAPSGESESPGESESSGESDPSGQLEENGSAPESGESQGGILEGLPPVPQLQAPPSFTARVSVSQPPANVPQQLAEPIDTARNFINDSSGSACGVISPDLAYFLGTPVEFLVRVDRDPSDPTIGRVAADGIMPQQGSGSEEYDAIATCLLREWTFRPPDTDAAAENEAPSSQVIITMQIAPAP